MADTVPSSGIELPAEEPEVRCFEVTPEFAGRRLDQFLVTHLDGISRSRIQLLLDQGGIVVDGKQAKASHKLHGTESIVVTGEAQPPPLRALAEEIPLDIVFEDEDLAVINKPAGMMVHAGAGDTDDARNRGTLVNALLHHFQSLSTTAGELRPGIVHRLDKETSGLIIVAKNDRTHQALSEMFSSRSLSKTYLALVHGDLKQDFGTINAPVSRDVVRRTRMTTRRSDAGRTAISHYKVLRRLNTRFGRFTLVSVRIETGRTHQIRVHMASIGHPVVGDKLYGAPAVIPLATASTLRRKRLPDISAGSVSLDRNFLHAAELEFAHPRTGKTVALQSPLPADLTAFLARIESTM
ncbi:Ribosomal large subunit pseudouridine synthase D [Acidisarcina polymorpha]|uniref:Pseudouridine synthase n=1 Tax=Acidisarcina polymorpha TaxID=2211140 RepID=A0A2Z5FYE7_9BACT|nr:RluA family pseudouridine synthase [Acidisarcina polymorpha]AXC11544.1 Ribosomal large subunit pseudouridine synthase D [Acidisarcina polymorpha]